MKHLQQKCPVCRQGKVIDKLTHIERPCTICNGTGYVKKYRDDVKRKRLAKGRMYSKIFNAILKWQARYFETMNPLDLIPMSVVDISKKTGVHLTSVSTKVKNMEIHGVKASDLLGHRYGNHHKMKVREMIRLIILNEDEPMPDPKICKILVDQGIPIVTRSVCMIRMDLGIPVYYFRRRKLNLTTKICSNPHQLSAPV